MHKVEMKTLGLLAIASLVLSTPFSAMADVYTLCPNGATFGGFGSNTATNVVGPLDGSCGANSAVKMDIAVETDYARLRFDSGMTGYPPGLTFGNLDSITADVIFSPGQAGDQPFYIMDFVDLTQGLGQTNATDQIIMLEFQPTNVSGNTMAVDKNATLFNLYDNDQGFYLQGGQADTNTIAGWIALFPFLSSTSIDAARTAIGLSGGGSSPVSLTVNQLDVSTVPIPAAVWLFGSALGVMGVRRRKISS